MGRIADALKRAERERQQTLGQPTRRLQEPDAAPVPEGVTVFPASSPVIVRPDEPRPLVKGLFESLVPFYERSSLITEQYRSLRTRLLSQNPNYEHRVLAITSGVPKEGKSVTALNLGCILAEIRHLKILVVDGDFRRSSLAKMLNQTESDVPGLADVLRHNGTLKDAIRETPIPNLSFIAAGQTGGQSAAELLTSERIGDVFRQLKNDFHYTIVDTPPATTVPDAGIIGQFCTGVIMIVRLHKTDEVAAKRAVRLLQVNNIPIVGCLLIGRDMSTGRYGYGYGYDYYRYYDYYSKGV